MSNKVLFGKEARDSMFSGIETVYNAVSSTLGASGRNVAYHQWGKPKITNDGVTIARQIDPVDPFEKMGAEFIKEAAEKTNSQAGDGTTTATTLAYHIIKNGLKEIENGANPMQLRREMEAALPKILERLKESSVPVDTDEALINVATVSAESREIGELIAKAVKEAGKDGIVSVEESNGLTITTEKVEGMQFAQGFVSPYMVTNTQKMESILTDCPVLVTDKTYTLEKDLMPLLNGLMEKGVNRILIIAEEVSGTLLQFLVLNKLKGVFTAVVVKKPYDNETLEDIATLTGAQAITKDKGIVNLSVEHLGHANKVIVTADTTTIIGGSGSKEKIDARAEDLRQQIATSDFDFEKEKMQERLAKMIGGVHVIHVGASTETEMKYLKLKIDDAVNATRAAVEEGIVAGGGSALFHLTTQVESTTKGESVLFSAMQQPLKKIVENCGVEFTSLSGMWTTVSGFNALTLKQEPDMIAVGIIDPAKVERCALTNAVSLAATFLTTDTAIAELPEKE